MGEFLGVLVGFVWNWPVAGLCLLGCIYFTLKLRFIQLRCFPHALALVSGKYDNPNETGQITHFQALSAALSGTIGLGNIAGVAIAIAMGGPGAILWMWIIGFFGMATKYTECALGTHYRDVNETTGAVRGGPMYYITKGLGKAFKPLAIFYAVAIIFASFGAASLFQSNQAAAALHEYYQVPTLLTGIVLFVLALVVVIGGIKRIANVTSKIVPLMCLVYVGCSLLICIINWQSIPAAFGVIIEDAFSGRAAAGGFMGVFLAGIRRAVFSNEAGLGSAAIAHAAVKTDYPIREGIVASLGPLIDTIIVCTSTALVIILSGAYGPQTYMSNSDQVLSFESSKYNYVLASGWNETSQQIPSNDDPFRNFMSGESVLEYQSSNTLHNPFIIDSLDVTNGMIRFSYFNQAGDMMISIFDAQDDQLLIGSFDVNSHTKTPGIDVEHYNTTQQWDSAVIHLPEGLPSDAVKLVFQPKGDTVHWYIDNVESVKSVEGIALTTHSFDFFFKGFGSIFITFSVLFFAFSTIITWSYYGETATFFLFGQKAVAIYKWVFVLLIIVGAVESLEMVISFSDIMLALIVLPNSLAIFLLSGKVLDWTRDYFDKLKAGQIKIYK